MDLVKRRASYQGMDCLRDKEQSAYMEAQMELQLKISWASQMDYGRYTLYFGVVVIFLSFLKHVWFRFQDRACKRNSGRGNAFVDVLMAYSRYFGYKQIPARICEVTALPPSLGSTLFILVSTLYMFCYCLAPHFWYRECRGFGSPPLAVRAGVMATALTPFIYIMSGKANLISFLTGISYERLNVYHQFVGLAALVLSIIHTIPFIWQDLREGGSSHLHSKFTTNVFYYSGICPLILVGLLCILSKSWFRKRCYELFLHLHWVFGIGYFATLWWHIDYSLKTQDYLYAALAFWATQILYRILVKTAFRPNALFMRPRKAELRSLGREVYEISIKNVNSMTWKPGQHCFLRFVGSRVLDNHPFSICSSSCDEHEVRFIIKPKKGLTGKLRKELESCSILNKKVYLDGPFGGVARDPLAFDKMILISTGTGVSATLSFLTSAASKIVQAREAKETIACQQLHFIWIVKSVDDVNWVSNDLNRCLDIGGQFVTVDIFIAHSSEASSDSIDKKEASADEKSVGSSEVSQRIVFHRHKPCIGTIFNSLKSDLRRRNLIVSSGSDSMKAEVRKEVANLQPLIFNSDMDNSGIEEIFLHTESFGW